MRITCPHCRHRGFSALAKLTATPAWPVCCKYCRTPTHPAPRLTGILYLLALALPAGAVAAWMGHWPWWAVGVGALLLAGVAGQLLARPSLVTRDNLTKRARLKGVILAVLVLTAVFGLLVILQMGEMSGQVMSSATTS